jgi:hypothetical protein
VAVAVTLKDIQIKLWTGKWLVGPKNVAYLNILKKEKKVKRRRNANQNFT